jgi:hypothetical protein
MKYFKVVNLFASQQDSYVHFESSLASHLISTKDYSSWNTESKAIHREMVRNFEQNCNNIRRFEVWFQEFQNYQNSQFPLNDPLGRSAHISMLQDNYFLEMALAATIKLFVHK